MPSREHSLEREPRDVNRVRDTVRVRARVRSILLKESLETSIFAGSL